MDNENDLPPQTQTKTGRVTWFDKKKGYGFINYLGKDYFVHHNQIIGHGYQVLKEGEKVRFKPNAGEKGGIAINVERIRD